MYLRFLPESYKPVPVKPPVDGRYIAELDNYGRSDGCIPLLPSDENREDNACSVP